MTNDNNQTDFCCVLIISTNADVLKDVAAKLKRRGIYSGGAILKVI